MQFAVGIKSHSAYQNLGAVVPSKLYGPEFPEDYTGVVPKMICKICVVYQSVLKIVKKENN